MPSKSQIVRRVLYALSPAIGLLMSVSDVRAQNSSPVVTVESACLHLFLWVKDSPTASWAARFSHLKGSGLDSEQIQMVVQAANAYIKDTAPLDQQVSQIRQDVKSNLVTRAEAAEQLKSIDQQRERILASAFDQLKVNLDRDGSYKLETFLSNTVKPTIRLVNGNSK